MSSKKKVVTKPVTREEFDHLEERMADLVGSKDCHRPGSLNPAPGGTQGHQHYNFRDVTNWIAFEHNRLNSLESQIAELLRSARSKKVIGVNDND